MSRLSAPWGGLGLTKPRGGSPETQVAGQEPLSSKVLGSLGLILHEEKVVVRWSVADVPAEGFTPWGPMSLGKLCHFNLHLTPLGLTPSCVTCGGVCGIPVRLPPLGAVGLLTGATEGGGGHCPLNLYMCLPTVCPFFHGPIFEDLGSEPGLGKDRQIKQRFICLPRP